MQSAYCYRTPITGTTAIIRRWGQLSCILIPLHFSSPPIAIALAAPVMFVCWCHNEWQPICPSFLRANMVLSAFFVMIVYTYSRFCLIAVVSSSAAWQVAGYPLPVGIVKRPGSDAVDCNEKDRRALTLATTAVRTSLISILLVIQGDVLRQNTDWLTQLIFLLNWTIMEMVAVDLMKLKFTFVGRMS